LEKKQKRIPSLEIEAINFGPIVKEDELALNHIPERQEKEKKKIHKIIATIALEAQYHSAENGPSLLEENYEIKKPIVLEEQCHSTKDIKPSTPYLLEETETAHSERKEREKSKFSLKKRLKKRMKQKKKKELWTKDDEFEFNGIIKKYEGNVGVLMKHFHSKKKLVNLKLISMDIEKCKAKIDSEVFKEDYNKFQGNWEVLSHKYEVDQKILKSYFYGYIFQSALNNRPTSNFANEPRNSPENEDRKSFLFENAVKEKGSPGLSISKKGEVSLSDFNDENLVEEKISYLSARKEILESINQYLIDVDTEEDMNLKLDEL